MALDQELLEAIRRVNEAVGVAWRHGETLLMRLEPEARRLHLGCLVEPGGMSLDERIQVSREGHAGRSARPDLALQAIPASFDWRNANGDNYISGVKYQGSCGSCVAFATAAVLDAASRIAARAPFGAEDAGELEDLSEAHMFFCGGGVCSVGWEIPSALGFCAQTGVVPEVDYPYLDSQQPCSPPPDWQDKVTRIAGSRQLSDPAAMKSWLSRSGPLVTSFAVYQDFYAYTGGVYSWNGSAALDGMHAVCVVGYDETAQAWICKNSWGADWGENGFFRIAYGECGIDALMWGVNAFEAVYPFPPGGRRFSLALDAKGQPTWSPQSPEDLGGWMDGDRLTVTCDLVQAVNPSQGAGSNGSEPAGDPGPAQEGGNGAAPPAELCKGLFLGAAARDDAATLSGLAQEAMGLSGGSGRLLGSGITSGPASDLALFYNAVPVGICAPIPLDPSERGALRNLVQGWSMTYNGRNTLVATERDVALVFAFGLGTVGTVPGEQPPAQ
ncbi:C1 family peptidase [Roseibium aestuarii]|uniref:C1 family peptidase n=1 Tax=Roseibium aestuarii TaxID=2600299 RepID=A0ABW4K1Y2_9HYPH|nr:C1 family peptidase [Roseibium aestuarii]